MSLIALFSSFASQGFASAIISSLQPNLVDYYTFDNPVTGNAAQEVDQGFGGTNINLVNGGSAMRVAGGAHQGSGQAIQTQQVTPTTSGNNDWKAGIYNSAGVSTMNAFNHVTQISVAGWVQMTGTNPNLNSNTASATDYYNAVGLFGILQGGTAAQNNGHNVRALVEIESNFTDGVTGYRLVALGRRVDSGMYILPRRIQKNPAAAEHLGSWRDLDYDIARWRSTSMACPLPLRIRRGRSVGHCGERELDSRLRPIPAVSRLAAAIRKQVRNSTPAIAGRRPHVPRSSDDACRGVGSVSARFRSEPSLARVAMLVALGLACTRRKPIVSPMSLAAKVLQRDSERQNASTRDRPRERGPTGLAPAVADGPLFRSTKR
jgi:hypothetical protein